MQMIYRNDASIEDLEIGECTMHRAITSGGSRYWHMWFRANRETDGQPFDFCVPMNPNGNYTESGVGGKTWGLVATSPGVWQVSPSINVLATSEVHAGDHPSPSWWHQTPTITGVRVDAPWVTETTL